MCAVFAKISNCIAGDAKQQIKGDYLRLQWSSGNMLDCEVTGPRFESHHRQLCLSIQPLRCTALGTGCTPLLHSA